ncbi:hypothetical protein IW262DRAFT_1299395 [Armillaria fumosa]|nr:hypothetical protein IW262DRAFT_1299395 [Armillaria fumosa]
MPVSCETAVKARPPPLMPPRSEISSPKHRTTVSIDREPIDAPNHTMPKHACWYSVLELGIARRSRVQLPVLLIFKKYMKRKCGEHIGARKIKAQGNYPKSAIGACST